MFDFLLSEDTKARRSAVNWLEVAQRIYDFRRDVLIPAQLQQLEYARGELREMTKDGSRAGALREGIERLEKALQVCGGRIYPASGFIENVEFFLVAAIVILGLRAYFVQPFKIPTNSMWPTYYGMTSEVFRAGEEPGLLRKAGRLAALGASNYSVTAPADGEVLLGVFASAQYFQPAYSEKSGRSMLVFPTPMREFVFSVGGQQTRVKVPADFDFDRVVEEAFFKGKAATLSQALRETAVKGQPLEQSTLVVREGARPIEARVYWVPLGKTVKRGEKLLSFDILTGDLLFVDRFTYNFFPPKVGSGFVFKTGHIPNLMAEDGTEKYFIKRLIGGPGDKLEIKKSAEAISDGGRSIDPKDGQLYRNGQPIDGAAAFAKNARKDELYPGYTADGQLAFGQVVDVPARSYFAMGDNSPRSKDSRYWGFVPDKDVVGRPLFIYYPLTGRWGPAK